MNSMTTSGFCQHAPFSSSNRVAKNLSLLITQSIVQFVSLKQSSCSFNQSFWVGFESKISNFECLQLAKSVNHWLPCCCLKSKNNFVRYYFRKFCLRKTTTSTETSYGLEIVHEISAFLFSYIPNKLASNELLFLIFIVPVVFNFFSRDYPFNLTEGFLSVF